MTSDKAAQQNEEIKLKIMLCFFSSLLNSLYLSLHLTPVRVILSKKKINEYKYIQIYLYSQLINVILMLLLGFNYSRWI